MHSSFAMCQYFYILLFFCNFCEPRFSENFQEFLKKRFGEDVKDSLTRSDLGDEGSFGGGNGTRTNRVPIIFVHGITMTAGEMLPLASYFQSNGYADEDLYCTSYGPQGSAIYPGNNGSAQCAYPKSVRMLIKAVAKYRGSRVDVISYSMGVIIARKAILGGQCVDKKENLGLPLTAIVGVFIGIAGPNHGAVTCQIPGIDTCSQLNGLICGSTYLNDINSREKYEGKKVYVIQAYPDETVGTYVCNSATSTSEIARADKSFTFYEMNHSNVWILTAPTQLSLLSPSRSI